MTQFALWDVVFGILILMSTFVGFSRGALVDLISTIVFVLSILGGLMWGNELGSLILSASEGQPNPWVMPVGFIAIFIVVYLIGTYIRGAVNVHVAKSEMRPADKMIGGLLGLARGLVLVLLILGMSQWVGYQGQFENTWFGQVLSPFVGDVVAGIAFVVGD